MSKVIDRALIDAAERGDITACREALARGADVHARNDWALWCAAQNGHLEVSRLLLDAGANVHARNDWALCCAAQNGNLEVVRLLLDAGAEVHADDDAALWVATYSGHLAVARALIQAGSCLVRPFEYADFREWDPDALSFMLDTPGCLSIEDAEHLRSLVLESSDARFEPVRQRLQLRDGAAAVCAPAGLEMP